VGVNAVYTGKFNFINLQYPNSACFLIKQYLLDIADIICIYIYITSLSLVLHFY